ncbi:homeodomain-interacting protein kinase 1-like [Scomber scombrus]|uniref:Homeodomain-interacting protein kinase 1-like n=1 Tax=Scomber scombrus TaxID=13677 RepID=A0AAV1PFE5_SCOSC
MVAVKIPKDSSELDDELTVLNYFKEMKLDNGNIVRLIDSFKLRDKRLALVFEMMEMTLRDFLMDQRNFTPLYFDEVRAIIQQCTSGLKALKDINVIHSDLKLDNIMLNVQPLTVKPIDFGVAFHSRTAEAPEVMLGLPFSEAIDMWSLGVAMGYIALGESLFPGFFDYDTTRAEFWDNNILSYGRKLYHYHSLDEVEHLDLVDMREVEVEEKKMCIDLLKGMLQLDANVRLTPDEVLAHPFITWSDQQYTPCLNDSSSQLSEPGTSETPALESIEDTESELTEIGELDLSDLESIEVTESELTEISELDTSDQETITDTESWTSQAAEAWTSLFLSYGTNESSTRQADEEGKETTSALSLHLLPCNMYQEDTATTSDDKEPQQNKKKKGFKRFCSLMRRMFCCCIRVEGNEG